MLTLCDYTHAPYRNSNLDAWAGLARWLAGRGYVQLVPPDVDRDLSRLATALRDFFASPEALWNIAFRIGLYESPRLNLGVNSGPMRLCWLNDTVLSATFQMAPRDDRESVETYQGRLSLQIDSRLLIASLFQKSIWAEDDEAPPILETETLLAAIASASGISDAAYRASAFA